jgi:hypothetical protein
MQDLTKEEICLFKKLNSPKKIQNFLDEIPINWEENGDSCMSPRLVLEKNKAHCIEGAIFAAAAMKFHGLRPLIVDLEAASFDYDHVIAVFKKHNRWGAITKTNHGVLRYREPIYRDIRELVMSFFHEYFTDNGQRTLRAYSKPVNLSKFDKLNWITSNEDIWFIPNHLTEIKHFPLVNKKQIASFKKPHPIEITMGKLVEWPDPLKRKKDEIDFKKIKDK